MDSHRNTVGQRIVRVVRSFEKCRITHGQEWTAVFLNEETVVVAIHRSLTETERALIGSPAGCVLLEEEQRRLFASASFKLKIESICRMHVRDTTVKIELLTGSVVLFFTTDTLGTDFPLSSGHARHARAASALATARPRQARQRNSRMQSPKS